MKLFAVGLFFVEGLGERLFIFWQGGRSGEGAAGGCNVSGCVLLSQGLGYSPVTVDFSAAFGPDLLLRNDTHVLVLKHRRDSLPWCPVQGLCSRRHLQG